MGWVEVVKAGPSEAIIISGFMNEPPTLIVGGRAFIIPWLHKMQRLNLNTRVRNVQWLIVTIVPASPVDELLVRFLKEIEEKLRRHILIKYPLQEKR